ncbi:MAG TPA: hypothetical protein VLU25_20505 [Acidobacteriota bacterium]|nr:hypothetical protein [Acidobacteriota bacterium]
MKRDDRCYRVWIVIEEVDGRGRRTGDRDARAELADFKTYSEARDFCYELIEHHVPEASGERQLLEEIESRDLYSAGD